eukprot:scaffold47_cov258-Pinguiococcus_pyrenoidosus.AAC.100
MESLRAMTGNVQRSSCRSVESRRRIYEHGRFPSEVHQDESVPCGKYFLAVESQAAASRDQLPHVSVAYDQHALLPEDHD